jgi:hypothetical protein
MPVRTSTVEPTHIGTVLFESCRKLSTFRLEGIVSVGRKQKARGIVALQGAASG